MSCRSTATPPGSAPPPLEEWQGDYPEPEFNLYPNGSHWVDKELGGYLAARFSVIDDLAWIVGSRLTSWETEGQSLWRVEKSNSAHGVLTSTPVWCMT